MPEIIGLVGVDFEHADLWVRSCFAFSDSQIMDLFDALLGCGCEECIVLSTCNRSEVYYVADSEKDREVKNLLGMYAPAASDCFYCLTGEHAVRHVFRVAAGLESAVVGEDQISGQVARALEFAELAGTAGKVLARLFCMAVSTAKLIKTRTGISGIPLSTAYIAIKKLDVLLNGLKEKNVMVIGSGEMSRLICRYLRDSGVARIVLCGRSCINTAQQAFEGCETIPFSGRYSWLPQVDAVICATSSPHAVLRAEHIAERRKPLCIVDMAMPPDVAEDVYPLENISVLNIDQICCEAGENLARRKLLSDSSGGYIQEACDEFADWLFRSRVDPAIESINRRCDAIAGEVEEYLFRKMELSAKEKKLVDKMFRAGMRRLVREPVLRLKALDDRAQQDEYVQVIKELFDINKEVEL